MNASNLIQYIKSCYTCIALMVEVRLFNKIFKEKKKIIQRETL